MKNSEIIEANGKLFVLDNWECHFTLPIRYRTAWPTGLLAQDYRNLVGRRATYFDNGVYRLDNGLFLRLENDGKTKPSPEHSIERRIPRPPGKKEYRNGRWCV